MKYRVILYHGADECFSCTGDELLSVTMKSNEAMAKERRGLNGPCDGGMISMDGAEIYTLKNEHWVGKGR